MKKWRFVLLTGVLGWGLPTAILFKLIITLTGNEAFTDGLGLALVIFPAMGVFFGLIMWRARLRHSQ
ncbi:hypothetical protein [Alteromonas halophila]|nr:hypothetical protein [Alteromonas halophila]